MDDNTNKEKGKSHKETVILLFLYILSILIFILSGSFTISTILNVKENNNDNIKVGQVKMDLIDNDETNIKLINTYPMKESEANLLEPFEFKISNEGTLPVIYRLKLQDVKDEEILKKVTGDKLEYNKINYSLVDAETNETIKTGLISDLENGILITEKILPRYSKIFNFRLWINENAGNESQNKYYIGEIVLEIDEILK